MLLLSSKQKCSTKSFYEFATAGGRGAGRGADNSGAGVGRGGGDPGAAGRGRALRGQHKNMARRSRPFYGRIIFILYIFLLHFFILFFIFI